MSQTTPCPSAFLTNILKQHKHDSGTNELTTQNITNLTILTFSTPTKQPQQQQVFISYAWYNDIDKQNGADNSKLQKRLLRLRNDLVAAGFRVLLDITNMKGSLFFILV